MSKVGAMFESQNPFAKLGLGSKKPITAIEVVETLIRKAEFYQRRAEFFERRYANMKDSNEILNEIIQECMVKEVASKKGGN